MSPIKKDLSSPVSTKVKASAVRVKKDKARINKEKQAKIFARLEGEVKRRAEEEIKEIEKLEQEAFQTLIALARRFDSEEGYKRTFALAKELSEGEASQLEPENYDGARKVIYQNIITLAKRLDEQEAKERAEQEKREISQIGAKDNPTGSVKKPRVKPEPKPKKPRVKPEPKPKKKNPVDDEDLEGEEEGIPEEGDYDKEWYI